ncbi:Os02g0278450, partial [Oryza sativa Japonica Group]
MSMPINLPFSWPSVFRTSCCALSIALGFLISSTIIHSSVEAVVSAVTHGNKGGDDLRRERGGEAVFLLQSQQHAEQIIVFVFRADAGVTPLLLLALLDDRADDPRHLRVAPPQAALGAAAQPPHHARRREQVHHAVPGHQRRQHAELPAVLLLPRALAAEHRPRDHVVRQRRQRPGHVDGGGVAAAGDDGVDEARHLLLTDGLEAAHLARAEELREADPARMAPVLAVGREDDALPAEADGVDRRAPGAVGERRVARLEHLHGGVRPRDDHGGHLAEPHQHQRAVPPRQAEQRAVWRRRAEEVVEAADDGEVPWPRRKVLGSGGCSLLAAAAMSSHDHERQREGESGHS